MKTYGYAMLGILAGLLISPLITMGLARAPSRTAPGEGMKACVEYATYTRDTCAITATTLAKEEGATLGQLSIVNHLLKDMTEGTGRRLWERMMTHAPTGNTGGDDK